MPEVGRSAETQSSQASQWSMARSPSGSGNASLSMEDFYKLLAAEMKYQDADNPMDTSEMMAQMVQTQMIATINQMNQISTITYASSMIGQKVTLGLIDKDTGMSSGETKTGLVTGAAIYGDSPMIIVDGERYYLSQVIILGEGPVDPPKDPPKDPPTVQPIDPPKDPSTDPPKDPSTDPPKDPSTDQGEKPADPNVKPGDGDSSGDVDKPGDSGSSNNPGNGETPGNGESNSQTQEVLQRAAAAMNLSADRRRTGTITEPVWEKW